MAYDPDRSKFSLSALGGGESRGEVGEAPAEAHLTLPSPRVKPAGLRLMRDGPLPLPPMGGEGLLWHRQ